MTLRPTNIRTRLTFWYVGVLALLLLVYATVVFAFQYVSLTRQLLHDEVQDVITVEGLLYFDAQGHLQLEQSYYSRPQSHLLVDRLMEVRDLNGNTLYRSPTLHGMPLGDSLQPGEGDAGFNERIVRLYDGSHVFRVSHIHTLQGRTFVIRLGYDLSPLRARMFQFFLALFIAIPVALLLAAVAGQSIARRALRPLEEMTERAQRITASDLSERLNVVNEADELGKMARVFNRLLQRLEQAFTQLQRFTADASHELRTPLAAIRTISEVALQKPNHAEAYREALSNVLEESARLNQTVDGLLLLAKAESTQPKETQSEFSLPELLAEVVTLLEVLAEERGIRIVERDAIKASVNVRGDRALLRIAFVNVLHNALKFAPDHSAITITLTRPTSEALQVSIEDEGPGIAPGEHERIFDRFFSGSASQSSQGKSAGLGLSIARLIVDRSGGLIRFEEAIPKGARCILEFPALERASADARHANKD